MRLNPLLPILTLSALGLTACTTTPQPHPSDHAEINAAMIQVLNRTAVDNAIVRQHTIFPYHFTDHSASLNDLGQRDLAVLAAHYRSHPGPLRIRRGTESDELFELRVASVLDELDRADVPAELLEWDEGLPGGDGIRAERVLRVLAADRTRPAAGGRSPTTGVSR